MDVIYLPSPDLAMTSCPTLVLPLGISSSSFPVHFVRNNQRKSRRNIFFTFRGHLYMTDKRHTFVASSSIPDLYCFDCSIHIHNHKNTFLFGPLSVTIASLVSHSSLVRTDLSSDQSIIPLSISIRNWEMPCSIRRGNLSIP